MDWELSKDMVTVVAPLLEAHNAIGLVIVAVFMYLRTDKVLKLFGIGAALLAAEVLIDGITVGLQPAVSVLEWIGLAEGVALIGAGVVFYIVGSSDWSPTARKFAIATAVVWAVVAIVLDLAIEGGIALHYSAAGFVVPNLHAITAMWIAIGLVFAFLEAAHLSVEHSHGEPYRTILLGTMSVYAATLVIVLIARDNDTLRFVNEVVAALAILVMWVSVVVHERKEITLEHAQEA